jgi:peptide/nickel transport system permease protein
MASNFLNRLAIAAITLGGVVVLVFVLMQVVPGDVGRNVLGISASPDAVEALNRQYGFEKPLLEQLSSFMSGVLRGDLGDSVFQRRPVSTIVGERIGNTLWILTYTVGISFVIGIALSLAAVHRPGGRLDRFVETLPIAVLGLPTAWVALLLLQYAAVETGLFPIAGVDAGIAGRLRSLCLPSLTLALTLAPLVIRSLRESVQDVYRSEYVLNAKARGIRGSRFFRRYVLRNALPPAIGIVGVAASFLVAGTVVVEQVFAIPGLGSLLISSVATRDLPVIRGLAVVFGAIVLAISVLSRVAVETLSPRTKN